VSVGLVGYNGVLLAVNGSLTTDLNCCCDVPPQPCPPCCIRIDFGTFNSDGDLYGSIAGSGFTVNLKIVMPTKASRIVCDDQNVTLQWSLDPSDNLQAIGGHVRFGAGWELVGNQPGVGPDGEVYQWGLVDWGADFESEEYEVTLKFRECFLDASAFLFYIEIGLDQPPFFESLDIVRCPSADLCCPEDLECDPCCALLLTSDGAKWNNQYYFVEETFVDGGRYTSVLEFGNTDGKVCIGGSLELKLYLVPPRHEPAGHNQQVNCTHPTWQRTGFQPAINPVDGDLQDESIDWGTLNEYEYEIQLEAPLCDSCEPRDYFDAINFFPAPFPSVGVSFFDCDLTNCCPCETCEEGFDQPCCFGTCAEGSQRCTRIVGYEFVSYESSDNTPVNRFIQTTEAPYEDSGKYLGGCEFFMAYRFSVWDTMTNDWGPESIVIDPDGFRYRNDGWYDGNAINAAIPGPCCGLVEGGYGPTNSGNPADFYDQRFAEVSFTVDNPCDPSCEDEE
jgi:hypothetical protein